jgi:hypothetical protein
MLGLISEVPISNKLTSQLIVLADSTLSAAASTITFDVEGVRYPMLWFKAYTFQDTSSGRAYIRLNADTGSNYNFTISRWDNTSTGTSRSTSQTFMDTAYDNAGTGSDEGQALDGIIAKPAAASRGTMYLRSTLFKGGEPAIYRSTGEWTNTANHITKVTFYPSAGNFDAGSYFQIYGVEV